MKTLWAAAALSVALGAVPAIADAQTFATTSKWVNLRAGPARSYPVIATVAPDAQVEVFGCLSTYRWCDVAIGPDRGWVYAGNLVYPYGARPEAIVTIGAIVGITVLTFILDDYWGAHYRDRVWYEHRYRWVRPPPRPRIGPPPHVTPRPPPRVGPPPRVQPPPHRVQPVPHHLQPTPRTQPPPPPRPQPGRDREQQRDRDNRR